MSFSGFPFLLGFLPLVLCGFAVAGRWGEAWAKRWLILASVAFYGVGAADFLPLLVLSVGGNLLLLHAMHGSAQAGRWSACGVVLNLAVLGWFKYLDPQPALGLSFFSFTQIGCLLYHSGGDTPPPRTRDYVLFAAFFPALLAGPILNPREMLPQFARTGLWRLTADNLATGSGFFLIGLLKKTVLADPLSTVVGPGFANPADLTLFPAWQAAMAYSLQLYFDFSGYTDMAVGLAWMVGLRFPDNFEQPYRARSVVAYWQRWHMSLTRFLMTHIHAPLTLAILRRRKRRGQPIDARAQATAAGFAMMIGVPIVATMVLVALWHGATLPFLLFGLLHAGFLLVNHAWRVHQGPVLPTWLGVTLTYLCVLVGAVLFRATTVIDAGSMLAGMSGLHGMDAIQPDVHVAANVVWLLLLYAVVWFVPTTRQWMNSGVGGFGWRRSPEWAVAMGCGATLGLLAAGGAGEFLYFRF
ncbi:MAG: alginate O-acetyltransferase complex protein AlgI [Acetobacteraceae bacterium]|nr:alginate O-acetyltransferase complex protein AlgI [Acetobacteraceae bacterium]